MTFGSDSTGGDDRVADRERIRHGTALSRRELLATAAAVVTSVVRGSAGVVEGSASPVGESDSDAASADRDDAPAIRAPSRTAVGDPFRIRLGGFEPNAAVAVEASATDARGVAFSGTWTRRTDAEGAVTIAEADVTQTPADPATATAGATRRKSGWTATGPGFDSPEPAGVEMLLHRLTPASEASATESSAAEASAPANFVLGERATVDVRLTARVGGDRRAVATATRVFLDPAVSRRAVEDAGLVGWLYLPPGEGPHAGVVTLHGSHAEVPHRQSRALATHGYATLALRYAGAAGLPESVDDVPVEYFRRATRWLTGRDDVRADAVGFVGISRGVEAALLAAADFPGRAVAVGYAGGGVLAPGANRSATAIRGWESAWTRNGEPIADADAVRAVFPAVRAVARGECETADCVPEAVRQRVSAGALRRAVAPVEEINGPVLLLAGTNDFAWPARELSALAIDRLDRRGHPHPYQLRVYDGAGHVFGLPYQSFAGEATGPRYGGSPAANASAAANAWPLVLRYLRAGTTDASRASRPSGDFCEANL